ncbi:MAG: BatA domain-containing protein [Sedimentisphaerales bacterium]|nr:BatA domain-containing protein [Sedimentisphaerales bacterium]
MSFLEWTFLFGSIAIAGPLLAHMLAKPRFRRLPFTMLQFLRSSQTESYSRRRLRDLLILLLRCAIIVLIALLFAQPIMYIKPKSKDMRHIYFLGLDNSTSMSYSDDSENYFKKMKDSAVNQIVSAETDAVFNICSLVSGNWTHGLSKQQALVEVKAMKIKIGSADIEAFLSGIRNSSQAANPADEVSAMLISDFTPQILKQFLNIQDPVKVDNYRHEIIASLKPINNASIVNAQTVDSATDGLIINVSVANQNQIRQKRRLAAKMETNDSVFIDLDLPPNQVKIYPIHLNPGFNTDRQLFVPVELSLSSGDGLEIDDIYYLAVRLSQKRQINILLAEANEDEMFLLDMAMRTLSGRSSDKVIKVRRITFADLSPANLDWANVLVCSSVTERLSNMTEAFSNFVEAGGRAVFFITGEPSAATLNRLWQLGILPALPKKIIHEQTFAETDPLEKDFFGVDNIAAKAILNYRIDRIPVAGFWECQQYPESKCLWQYKNGSGFIYFRQIGNGTSILVNTSADDSLGALTKSSVSVALCQYLLGEYDQIRDYSFTCNQRIVLPITDINFNPDQKNSLWIRNCDGSKKRAVLTDSFLSLLDPGSVGWLKTFTEPELYAGVNLPPDETVMNKPATEEVDNALRRVFSTDARNNIASAETFDIKKQKPVWITLAWIIIALLLVESFVANRLSR